MQVPLLNIEEITNKIQKLTKKGKIEKLKTYIKNNIELVRTNYGPKNTFLFELYENLITITREFADENFEKKDYKKSLELYLQCYKLSEPLPGSDWTKIDKWYLHRIDILKNVANNYEKLEQIDKAIEYLRVAMNLEEKASSQNINLKNQTTNKNINLDYKFDQLYFMIGNHLITMENYKEALRYLHKLEAYLNKEYNLDEIFSFPNLNNNLAKIKENVLSKYLNVLKFIFTAYFKMGKIDEGEKYYEKRVAIVNELQNLNFKMNFLGSSIKDDESFLKNSEGQRKHDHAESEDSVNSVQMDYQMKKEKLINKQRKDLKKYNSNLNELNVSSSFDGKHITEKSTIRLKLNPVLGALKTFKLPKIGINRSSNHTADHQDRPLISDQMQRRFEDIYEENQIKIQNKLQNYLEAKTKKLSEIIEEKESNNINKQSENNSEMRGSNRKKTIKSLEKISLDKKYKSNKYSLDKDNPEHNDNKNNTKNKIPNTKSFKKLDKTKYDETHRKKIKISEDMNKHRDRIIGSYTPSRNKNFQIDKASIKNNQLTINDENSIEIGQRKKNRTLTSKHNKEDPIIKGLQKMVTNLEVKRIHLPPMSDKIKKTIPFMEEKKNVIENKIIKNLEISIENKKVEKAEEIEEDTKSDIGVKKFMNKDRSLKNNLEKNNIFISEDNNSGLNQNKKEKLDINKNSDPIVDNKILSNEEILILVKQKLTYIPNPKNIVIMKFMENKYYKVIFSYKGIVTKNKKQTILLETKFIKMSSINSQTLYKIFIQFEIDIKKYSDRNDFFENCLGFLNSDSQELSIWPIVLFYFELWFNNFLKKFKKSIENETNSNKGTNLDNDNGGKNIFKNFKYKYERYFQRLNNILEKKNSKDFRNKHTLNVKTAPPIEKSIQLYASFVMVNYFYCILNFLELDKNIIGEKFKLKNIHTEEKKLKKNMFYSDMYNIYKNFNDFIPIKLLKVLIFDSYINPEKKKNSDIKGEISSIVNLCENEEYLEDFLHDG